MYLPPPTGGDFELAPAGTHLAVCYRVIDLGTQTTTFNNQPKQQHKIQVNWELADEKMKDGRPFIVSNRYTWSMSEKATLRKHLESWRGKAFADTDFGPTGFNIKNIIGKGCLLTITHSERDGKHYANIGSVGKLMKGMVTPVITNEAAYLWLNPGLFDQEVFNSLTPNMQGTIMQSPEYQELLGGSGNEPPPHDAADFHDDPMPPF